MEELQLLILVSPQIAKNGVKMTSKPSAETAGVEDEISKSTNGKSEELRTNANKSTGEKMFTW